MKKFLSMFFVTCCIISLLIGLQITTFAQEETIVVEDNALEINQSDYPFRSSVTTPIFF